MCAYAAIDILGDHTRTSLDVTRPPPEVAETVPGHRRPGPYQLQAAIVACHAEAKSWEDTDWPQIVILYDMLLRHAPSPVTRLHRAIAPSRCGTSPARRKRWPSWTPSTWTATTSLPRHAR